MARCQIWQLVALHLTCIYTSASSDLHPNRFVRQESFLGLVVPECREWQCRESCDQPATLASFTRHSCQCDINCLLYGDCCYDFYLNCRRLPEEEIREIFGFSRITAYTTVRLPSDIKDDHLLKYASYQECTPGISSSREGLASAVYLVGRCPQSWSDEETRQLCEENSNTTFNEIPVSTTNDMTSYKNIHCAFCHKVASDSIMFWGTKLSCDDDIGNLETISDRKLFEMTYSGSCSMTRYPPSTIPLHHLRTCQSMEKDSSSYCLRNENTTQHSDPEHWYSMVVENVSGTKYQNPHHAKKCNINSTSDLSCVKVQIPDIVDSDSSLHSFKADLIVHQYKEEFLSFLRTDDNIARVKTSNCRPGEHFDIFRNKCVSATCPSGWYRHIDDCLPNQANQIPADYKKLQENSNVALLYLTFESDTELTKCIDIWNRRSTKRILTLLRRHSGDILKKSCQFTKKRQLKQSNFLREASGNITSSFAKTRKILKRRKRDGNERRKKDIRHRRDTTDEDALLKSRSVLLDDLKNANSESNDIESTTPITISHSLREKLLKVVGIGLEQRRHIQVELELKDFVLAKLDDIMLTLMVEVRDGHNIPDDEGFYLTSAQFYNFNQTQECGQSLEIKDNLTIYKMGGILHAYDTDSQEQMSLADVPFILTVGSGSEDLDVTSSTRVFLCHTQTTQPSLLECPLSYRYYDQHEYVLVNNSLYIDSSKKIYEKGSFQIRGSFAYVCSPVVANVTNVTVTSTVLRGFFTMPYTQYIVVMVCCCISLACLLATFITYVCFAQLRDISGIILMCLTASLFVAQLLFAVGDEVGVEAVCVTIALSLHFLWLSVFSWMNVLTYDIAHKLRLTSEENADKDSKAFKEYCIFAWGVPFLLVGICAALDFAKGSGFEMQYAHDSCWIGSVLASLIGFALPVVLLLLANLALFVCTIYALQTVARVAHLTAKQKTSRRLLVIYSGLTMIMGLTWMFAYLAALLDIQEIWFVFGALNALQGIFIVGCFLLKSRVIKLYKTRFGQERKPEYPPEEFL